MLQVEPTLSLGKSQNIDVCDLLLQVEPTVSVGKSHNIIAVLQQNLYSLSINDINDIIDKFWYMYCCIYVVINVCNENTYVRDVFEIKYESFRIIPNLH